MRRFALLFAAILASAVAALNRVRVRWYRHQRLPTVRESLAAGSLRLLPGRDVVFHVPAGRLTAADSSPHYDSTPSSLLLLAGRPAPFFRLASTLILPTPPSDLSILRASCWPLADRPLTTSQPSVRAAAERPLTQGPRLPAVHLPAAKPSYFGVNSDLSTTRPEREAPRLTADPALARFRLWVPQAARLPARPSLHVFEPARFGLLASGGPPLDDQPTPPRLPPKLRPADACFRASRVDRVRAEHLVELQRPHFGEGIEEGVESFFNAPRLGASTLHETRQQDPKIEAALEEVREQYLLRRDIERPEIDKDEIGRLQPPEGGLGVEVMRTYTGLTFEDFQPQPVPVLRMRLENPPLDMAPSIEASQAQLAWLMRAVREHVDEPPPKPST